MADDFLERVKRDAKPEMGMVHLAPEWGARIMACGRRLKDGEWATTDRKDVTCTKCLAQ